VLIDTAGLTSVFVTSGTAAIAAAVIAAGARHGMGEAGGGGRRPHAAARPVELLEAARPLVDDGFVVLPYTNDDPVLARQLERQGCGRSCRSAPRPGPASGCATRTKSRCRGAGGHPPSSSMPESGPSDSAFAMELGCRYEWMFWDMDYRKESWRM
jgi:hypothetical protein